MNPMPKAFPTRTNPRPLTPARQVYLSRTVRVYKAAAANTTVNVTLGDVATALGAPSGTNVNLKVLGLSAWNTTNQASSSNFLKLTTGSPLFNDPDTVFEVDDVGNSANLAGVRVNVPDLSAAVLVGNSSSSTVLCTLSGTTLGLTGSQTYCVDMQVRVQVA